MKIDESCINHNALRLIADAVSELYEYADDSGDMDNLRLVALGEIRGICQMADVMKKVQGECNTNENPLQPRFQALGSVPG